ncbi:MAG: DsrE family protein [Burkholderiaceae bacterium]|jgi:intracellular sulfur oxidation DsrE/DsrF family protein
MQSTVLAARLITALALGCVTGSGLAADAVGKPAAIAADAAQTSRERAIFAVSDNDPAKWNLTLGNINNAIDGLGAGNADIELVVYGPGINMLKKDSPVAEKIAAALARGVHIAACQNSMRGAKLELGDLAPGVGPVPSGVVELIHREHAGYAYVRS